MRSCYGPVDDEDDELDLPPSKQPSPLTLSSPSPHVSESLFNVTGNVRSGVGVVFISVISVAAATSSPQRVAAKKRKLQQREICSKRDRGFRMCEASTERDLFQERFEGSVSFFIFWLCHSMFNYAY
ncbi:hypothetical protein QVD17_08583 [Tagetes erecta]|uniref:Uncharacterized protein n=1 Tax=Tagetes erecta TaxID=13708 RepID=A0AAD8P4K9_TARER|nr:hypothetical protein QVD17_08583 [Tagetes erecta]